MKQGLRAILFLLSVGQAFAAGKKSDEEAKKVEAKKADPSKTHSSSACGLSKPANIAPGMGTMKHEQRKDACAEKQRRFSRLHARSKTLPVFDFLLPQGPIDRPLKYIKARPLSDDDVVWFYQR